MWNGRIWARDCFLCLLACTRRFPIVANGFYSSLGFCLLWAIMLSFLLYNSSRSRRTSFLFLFFSASLMALNSSVPYQLMLMGALFTFFFCLYCDGWINLARRGKKYNQGRADSTICALPCLDLSFQPFGISVCRCPEPLNQVERR